MLKRIFKSTRITAIVLMALSVITPVQMSQVAQASGTITKEITVLGTDGNPYVGALVTMKFQPPAGGNIKTYALTPVLTNSSGVATLTFSDALTAGELNVQPPATDTTTAVFTDYMNDHANSSPVTINLRRSQVRINTLTYDNQPAPAFGGVSNGFREWVLLIRNGIANIGFPESAANNTCTRFTIFAGDDAIGSFRKYYATKLSGSGETRTATIYTDPGTCLVEAPKVDGVYQLKFNRSNVSGNLLSNTGQALTFADNQGYDVQLEIVDSNGIPTYSVPGSYSFAGPNGSWNTYVDTATAGKYQLVFHGYGNSEYPTFANKYVWVTNDHKLSWSADGSNPSDSLTQNFNIPLPNLKFSFIDTGTGQNVPINLGILKKVGNAYSELTGWGHYDGAPSVFLEDGDYKFNLSPYSDWNPVVMNFTITSGVATFVSSTKNTYSFNNGVYTVWLPASNAKIRLKDQSNNPVQGWVDFCPENGSCIHANANSAGLASAFVPDGTYSNIFINPGSNQNLAGTKLSGTVTNGVLSITGKTATEGIFDVQIPTANIKFTVTHPTTSAAITSGWISLETADSSWNSTGWVGNADINNQTPGYARAALADGRYLAIVNVHSGVSGNEGLAGRTYRVTMSGGVPSVSLGDSPITAVNGKFPVSPAAANLEVTVQNLSGVAISDGWIDVCSDLGGGNTGSCRGYGFNQNGQVSQSLANGNWIIVVRPGSSTGMSQKSYSVSVSGGVVTISGASQTNGRWILTGSAPNITGSFTVSSGSLAFTGNQGISLTVQKYNNGNWEWQNGGSWVRATNYALNITAQGRYRIVANPVNFTEYVMSYSSEFWVNGSAQVSTSQNGTYSDSITAFNIALRAPNLKMKVINPLDNSLLPGGWVSVMKINGQSKNWITNADIFNSNPGLTGTNISEVGQYTLTVNPPNGSNAIVGLAAREYQLTVEANDSMTVSLGGVPVAIDNNRFVLAPATANVTARIVKADGTAFGNSNGKWANVNLQKFNAERNFWEWSNTWGNVDQDGYVSMRAESAGLYRLRIEPNGDSDATVTYSQEFTVTSEELNTFKKEFGNLTLAGPSIRISVASPSSSSTPLNYANIEIRKDGNWLDWANTNRTGVAGISLKAAGNYEFVVHPTNDLQGTTSRKTYKITATANSEGVVTATAVTGTGVSVANGVTTLLLGSPTLSGTVKEPGTSATVVANSQVVAVNASTGQEMWEYSASTNSSGVWALSLPAGTYKIKARAPWGTATYGDSELSGDVVVDSSGAATTVPGGDQTAASFLVRLKAPTWSGLVKNPAGTAVIPNARVCLLLSNNWTCTNADNSGAWALSAPTGFTSFTGTNPILEIHDDFSRQYPMKRFEGASAVNSAIGTSGSNIVLQFADANTQITITAGGNPVANVWVSAERDGSGWLGGATTNASGVAKLNIASPGTAFRARVELNGNPTVASSYASTMKSLTSGDFTNNAGVYSATIALAEPNFKVVLREPTTDGSVGNAIPYSWIELYSDTTGSWLGGASTDANGFASFKLEAPVSGINNYTVSVNPAWNASTNYSKQAYAVAVSASALTVINKTTTAAVNTQLVSGRTVYPLTLGTPSVTGVVVDPSGGTVANSWVVPRDAVTSEYYWQQGVHSRRNGEIAINLINGQYTLEANVPWGSSNVAKSASCAVTVSGGTISTGGACVQDGATKTVRLALRAPNVTFTLKIGGSPVANANVGIGSGKWFTNAQSDSQGNVSLFVDAAAIRSLNNYTTAQPLYVWVDPPYGGSVEMARWDCASTQSKPICSGLVNVPATGDYPTTTLGDVTGVSPNTRIQVVAPGTSAELANSWVTVFAFDPANVNNRRWLGGANSNSSGYASMNLDTSTVSSSWRFAVEINAPWNQRQLYAANYDNNSGSGFTWAALTGGLVKSPKSPNLTVTVNASNAVANKFGWIGVEEVNSSDVFQAWVGGYGLNESGISSIFLAASKRYRITSYPGQGRSGAKTTCIVTTNNFETVTAVSNKCDAGTFSTRAVTIALDGGNIVGMVKKASDNTPLVGAIVYANNPNAVDESTAVITSTGADGRYGLMLDPTKTWNIKVFPVGTDKASLGTGSLSNITPPSVGSSTRDFSIAAA
jgi:hypothetical protein